MNDSLRLNGADDFVRSSKCLHEKSKELDLIFDVPAVFLCGHAFELLLKAFLRSQGFSVKELASRLLGHDLIGLYDKALENGLQHISDDNRRQLLELLDSVMIHARYTQIGGLMKPNLEPAYEMYRELREYIEPVVQLDLERLRSAAVKGRR